MAKKISKREVENAYRIIDEQIDLIEEIQSEEGYKAANGAAMWGNTARRMADYIGLLIRADAPLPPRLVASWRRYGNCAWHAYAGQTPQISGYSHHKHA